jgi:hypothetical protein
MKHEQLILKLEQMVIDGIESHNIDKEIENQRLPDGERKVVFRHIQDFQVEQLKLKQAKEENFNIRVLGWTVLSVGLIITVGSFIFNPSVTVIAYGAILYGLYVLMRRKLNPIDEDNGTKKKSMFDKGLFKKF